MTADIENMNNMHRNYMILSEDEKRGFEEAEYLFAKAGSPYTTDQLNLQPFVRSVPTMTEMKAKYKSPTAMVRSKDSRPQIYSLSIGATTSLNEVSRARKNFREIRAKIGLSKVSYNFGFYWIFLKLLILLTIWVAIKYFILINEKKAADAITNCIRLYASIVRAWNVHSSLDASLQNIILTPNLTHSVGLVDAKDYYLEQYNILHNEIVPTLQDLRDKDLGTFTSKYNYLTDGYSLCEEAMQKHPDQYVQCGSGYLSFMSGNIISTLKQKIALKDSFYRSFLIASRSNKLADKSALAAFLSLPEARTLLFYGGHLQGDDIGTVSVIYYAVLVDLAVDLDKKLSIKYSTDQFLNINFPLILLLLLLIYFMFARQLMVIPKNCTKVLFLFSLELLQSNFWLLKKMKNSTS